MVADEWLASRIDAAERSRKNFTVSIGWINRMLADRDPESITIADVQRWIQMQVDADSAPGSIRLRMSVLTQILDFAEVEPNPTLSRRVRRPRAVRKDYRLPTRGELALIYQHIDPKKREAVRMMEHTGMRVSEVVALKWEDLDRPRHRLLVPEAKTSAGRRWIDQIDGLPALADKPEGVADDRRVFEVTESMVSHAMGKACEAAKIRHYSPHDLRHLHASRLLHDQVLSPAQIAARLGHATALITLGTYSHVVPPD
jgi:integrase/recombinase XerC